MLRKSKRITQDVLAEQIGIDSKNVSKIEDGNHFPSAETAEQNMILISAAD